MFIGERSRQQVVTLVEIQDLSEKAEDLGDRFTAHLHHFIGEGAIWRIGKLNMHIKDEISEPG